jgi:large subunit ribosomal protein L32
MSVPKKRRTKSSVGQRRSHHGLSKITLNKCPQCGKSVKPHQVCAFCGSYKGKEAIKVATPKKKSTK